MNRDADYRKALGISSGIWWVGCGGWVGGWGGVVFGSRKLLSVISPSYNSFHLCLVFHGIFPP